MVYELVRFEENVDGVNDRLTLREFPDDGSGRFYDSEYLGKCMDWCKLPSHEKCSTLIGAVLSDFWDRALQEGQ